MGGSYSESGMDGRRFWDQWDDGLSECIRRDLARGDCRETRAYFDSHFWSGTMQSHPWMTRVVWEHVKLALRAESKPMLKLLIAWGATVTEAEVRRLHDAAPDKFSGYLRLLAQCGLRLKPETAVAAAARGPVPPEDMIPQEWKRLLGTFQKVWEQDAVIAGSCLSHLFNDKAARSVDIFLPHSHGNEKTKRKLLAIIFKEAGLEVTEQITRPFPDSGAPEAFPAPETGKVLFTDKDGYASRAETWTVIAGPQKTAYRITFADGVAAVFPSPERFGEKIRESFAFGLCQASFDGEKVETTPAFGFDVKNKQITLVKKAGDSAGELQRLVKRYPDWKLCPESKKLLPPSGWGGAIGYPM